MAATDYALLVDGVEVPAPDTYSWGEQDVSAPDAGRTQDANATMYKMLITRKVKLQLGWNNRDEQTIASIIGAFSPEYVEVTYFDARDGDFATKTFYVGDRSVPFREIRQGGHAISTLTFNIIER
jgi:hypothetical protein